MGSSQNVRFPPESGPWWRETRPMSALKWFAVSPSRRAEGRLLTRSGHLKPDYAKTGSTVVAPATSVGDTCFPLPASGTLRAVGVVLWMRRLWRTHCIRW